MQVDWREPEPEKVKDEEMEWMGGWDMGAGEVAALTELNCVPVFVFFLVLE